MRRFAHLVGIALFTACGASRPSSSTTAQPQPVPESPADHPNAPPDTNVCSGAPRSLPALPVPTPGSDDCLDPLPPLPVMTTYQVFVPGAQYRCRPTGDGSGNVAVLLTGRYDGAATDYTWDFLISGGAIRTVSLPAMSILPQPRGYVAQWFADSEMVLQPLDERGTPLHDPVLLDHQTILTVGPGGVLVGTRLDPALDWILEAFGADACPLWSRPVGIAGRGEVWIGMDELARVLALQGSDGQRIAKGIWGRWFDRDGTALTDPFLVADGLIPGDTGALETAPLYGALLAVKRVGWAASLETGIDILVDEWIAVVPSGSTAARPAPAWLASRPFTAVLQTRGGYAVLSEYRKAASPCGEHVEILAASGASCGSYDLAIDSGSCSPAPAVEADPAGTLFQLVPLDREIHDPADPTRLSCTVRYWPAAFPP